MDVKKGLKEDLSPGDQLYYAAIKELYALKLRVELLQIRNADLVKVLKEIEDDYYYGPVYNNPHEYITKWIRMITKVKK